VRVITHKHQVCCLTRIWFQDAEDRAVASAIQQALLPSVRLELFPKSTIDVFVTILDNDGIESCISAATTAASTALADAGIEMLGLVMSCTAVSTIMLRSRQSHSLRLVQSLVEQEAWLDPTEDEVKVGRGTLTLACMPALGTITSVSQNGRMAPDVCIQVSYSLRCQAQVLTWMYLQSMEACQTICTDIHTVVAQSLLEGQNSKES
jgi:exosome complex component MTR3